MTNTEPYLPWMQAAQGCIKEVKRGSSRKMLRSGSPKKLWDHSLELEGAVRSHTCLGIYALDGQVPETVMMGQTADISHLCEYELFDWVMFYEPVNGYPNDKVTIGRYIGPAIDVGTAMTMKILKANGGVCMPLHYPPMD